MSDKKTPTRIYAVTRKGHGTVRLVEAPNWAQALRHIAHDEYEVDVAEQRQLVECIARGVKVEVAGKEPVPPPHVAPHGAGSPPLGQGATSSTDATHHLV